MDFFLQDGDSAITTASYRGHTEVVKALILQGADVNQQRPVRVCTETISTHRSCVDRKTAKHGKLAVVQYLDISEITGRKSCTGANHYSLYP